MMRPTGGRRGGGLGGEPRVEEFFDQGAPKRKNDGEKKEGGDGDRGGFVFEEGGKVNGVGLVDEIDPVGKRSCEGKG